MDAYVIKDEPKKPEPEAEPKVTVEVELAAKLEEICDCLHGLEHYMKCLAEVWCK